MGCRLNMGLYDTIYFDRPYLCPNCQNKIFSVQVKAFDNSLENYYIKDCISHAEDIRIIKDELFCDNCKFIGKNIYIVVNRGILLGVTETLEEGEKLLNDLNLEKLILMYHDQYKRYKEERAKKNSYRHFLYDLREWYGEKLYEKPQTGLVAFSFFNNSKHLKGAKDPIESIERFLTYDKMIIVLEQLWKEGEETLSIYYPEDIKTGEEKWSVDVYQDEINDRCKLNWTWTVINKKELEEDKEKEDEMPEWEILVDGPFSEDVVRDAVENWLKDRNLQFKIRMIPIEEARGSGAIKELRKRLNENKL